MPTYRDVTNFPPAPSNPDGYYINLTPSGGGPSQKYAWQGGGGPGIWIPVQDDDGPPLAGGPTFLVQRTQRFTYSFADQGGAISNITLVGGTIPSGVQVSNVAVAITEAFTGAGGCSLKFSLESSGDINTNTAVASYGFTGTNSYVGDNAATGLYDMVTGAAGATKNITTTAERSLVMAITMGAVTAGAVTIDLTYSVPA